MNITKNEIHIYNSFSSDLKYEVDSITKLLNEPEIAKANRYKFEKDKINYICFRALLRIILGKYLNTDPAEIVFSYTEKDKPFIKNSDIKFNLSHSNNFAVYAITNGNEIGVDTEFIKDLPDAMSIAKRFFSEKEVKQFSELSDVNYKEAFFNCWTGKESFIKAIGEGLSFPLADFSVSFLPGEKPEIKWIKHKPEEADKWSLFRLDIKKNYISSVAIRSKRVKIINKEIEFNFNF